MEVQKAGKRGRPSAAERRQRRDTILDVAVGLFAESGFTGTTIESIAAGAGVAKRTVYTYFEDKEGMFHAAIERLHCYRENLADAADLEEVATRIVFALHSDQAVALHRLVVAEALRFPQVAETFYSVGPGETISYLADWFSNHGYDGGTRLRAELFFSLLLGEPHRRRLLGLAPAPTQKQARAHALAVLVEFPWAA